MCFLKVYAEKVIDKILSTLLRQTNQIWNGGEKEFYNFNMWNTALVITLL